MSVPPSLRGWEAIRTAACCIQAFFILQYVTEVALEKFWMCVFEQLKEIVSSFSFPKTNVVQSLNYRQLVRKQKYIGSPMLSFVQGFCVPKWCIRCYYSTLSKHLYFIWQSWLLLSKWKSFLGAALFVLWHVSPHTFNRGVFAVFYGGIMCEVEWLWMNRKRKLITLHYWDQIIPSRRKDD